MITLKSCQSSQKIKRKFVPQLLDIGDDMDPACDSQLLPETNCELLSLTTSHKHQDSAGSFVIAAGLCSPFPSEAQLSPLYAF